MADYLRNIVKLQKQGKPVGIYSACTGNRLVLEACMRHAMETGTVLLIESTANQVDQYGGYTGMKPADFMKMAFELAANKAKSGCPWSASSWAAIIWVLLLSPVMMRRKPCLRRGS